MTYLTKILDYPPIWLLGFLAVAWALANAGIAFPVPLWGQLIGGALIGIGVLLMGAAVFAMWCHRTTVIPHRVPSAIITDGVYGYTRNPIYLGDVFTLLGFSLLYGSPAGVLLVPVFIRVIEKRFVAEEEKWLGTEFASEFQSWAAKTRRWL